MIDNIIKKFIVHYATNVKHIDFTHEWIYVRKKQHFVKENKPDCFCQNRYELYDSLTLDLSAPFTYIEFGVYKGESINYWVSKNINQESKFFGFDTFTGLPEDWTKNKPKGSYSAEGKIPVINDKRVAFEVGLFNETLPTFIKSKFNPNLKTIIHLDADLYSSTMYVLSILMPYLKKDDIIIFDEFGGHLLHEFKAFCDFKSFSGINLKLIAATKNFQQTAFKIK